MKGAYDHLLALEKKGYIEREGKHSRAITIKEYPKGREHMARQKQLARRDIRDVPMVGRIAAGPLDAAIEDSQDTFVVAGDLLSDADHFALTVKGESMIGAGIFDGDMVIIRKQDTAKPNDIVVALIEGIEVEATLKRFMMHKGKPILHAENPRIPDIPVNNPEALRINGVVVGLYRKIK